MILQLSDFLRENGNTAFAIRCACDALRDGDTLALGGGKIELFANDPHLLRRYYYISNNDRGEKKIAFPLIGKKNVTIDGEGAELLFHGEMMPFVIDGCDGAVVKNLSIDYASPFFAQAEILEADENHTALKFDQTEHSCTLKDGGILFKSETDGWEYLAKSALCLEFDRKTRAPAADTPTYFFDASNAKKGASFLASMFRSVCFEAPSPDTIVMRGNVGFTHRAGNYLVCTFGSREYSGFLINDSKNTAVEDVLIYHTPSMGIICQLSENIRIRRVRAELRAGSSRMLTINADALHFVNCRGKIEILSCKFVNMDDDAANIHGFYLPVRAVTSPHTLQLGYGHGQHMGINIFRPGDTMGLVDTGDFSTLGRFTVERSDLLSEKTLRVTVKEPLPALPDAPVGEIAAVNCSAEADLTIADTESGCNRPRGFLIGACRRAVIERCVFYNMYQGVSLGSEAKGWYESGPTAEVVIRDNDFRNSAYAGGCAIVAAPNVLYPEKIIPFHNSVRIEGNRFTMHEKRLLTARNVKELVFKNNIFIPDPALPAHSAGSSGNERGIEYKLCGKVEAEDPVVREK